jgi:hypothetical protein
LQNGIDLIVVGIWSNYCAAKAHDAVGVALRARNRMD